MWNIHIPDLLFALFSFVVFSLFSRVMFHCYRLWWIKMNIFQVLWLDDVFRWHSCRQRIARLLSRHTNTKKRSIWEGRKLSSRNQHCCLLVTGPWRGSRVWRWACLFVCLSVRDNISRSTCPIFNNLFVCVTYGHDLVLLWQQCNSYVLSVLCMMFVHNGPCGAHPSIPLQRVTSLYVTTASGGGTCNAPLPYCETVREHVIVKDDNNSRTL